MQTINLGNIANDGTGDDLRVAFQKVNNNFSELSEVILNATPTFATNVGDTGVGVYLQKEDDTLEFKKLVHGDLTTITDNGTTITIDTDLSGKSLTDIANITVTGNITAGVYFIGNLQGNVLGNLIGTVYAPAGANAAQGNIVGRNGLITSPGDPNYAPALVDGISVQTLNNQVNTFDFGSVGNQTFTSPIQYLLSQIGADFGTFTNPTQYNIDAGSFV